MTARRVAIVGGGHNALTAAAYLAQAGLDVTVLERLDHVGGAAVSEVAFDGVDARLSRYSYLVSLLPARIIRELGLSLTLKRRRHSSYTPLPGTDRGLLIDNGDDAATDASLRAVGSSLHEWREHGRRTTALAEALFPTVCDPLLLRSEARRMVDAAAWEDFVERPIGEVIERTFASDLVRGVVLTDALIGTLASAHELAANRCYLYHVIGGGTGDWDVPVGGMGAVTGELERAARAAGARIVTGAEVTWVAPDGEVRYTLRDRERILGADVVLSGVAPAVLARLMGEHVEEPVGSQVKINMLLRRLPRLADSSVDPAAAFGGTFHINEGYRQLGDALDAAREGRMPSPLPAEIYCHSLADPSILSPELAAAGAHTLTLFGLHVPHGLDASREELTAAALASLDGVLGEPIEPLLMTDAAGRPCLETKTTADLAADLALPGGNIFHGPLSWPFAEDDEPPTTAAERWGVATGHDRVLVCGAGARRGGGVSGIGGHNAAMAVLSAL